jgi:NAD(P)-dependent dehydrogenase (short-subunit alcohol dehydrogenase family)
MGRKKAIITGGEIGMGRGIAMVLAEEGYDIAFSYYPKAENAEASVETTMSMLKQRGAQGWYFPADLSGPDAPKEYFAQAVESLGGLDLLVNNAGIPGDMSVDSQHTTTDDIRETLEVNFVGTFLLTKALLPLLGKNQGRIVNITVPSEISPYWHPLAYVASKAAQNAMTGVMATEFLQSNTPIEIFSVHPGPTTTDLNGNMALPGFHDIETVGEKMAELINDGQNHQGEFIELYPIVKED